MTTGPAGWEAELEVRVGEPRLALTLEQVLRPESTREVPRARVTVERSGPTALRLHVRAGDVGAMRAALNTYLGWIHLAVATARASAG